MNENLFVNYKHISQIIIITNNVTNNKFPWMSLIINFLHQKLQVVDDYNIQMVCSEANKVFISK